MMYVVEKRATALLTKCGHLISTDGDGDGDGEGEGEGEGE